MASEYGKRHHEQGDGGGLAVERDLGLAEVDLGLTRAVGQGDEDLGRAEPPGGDGLLDDGDAAGVTVLIAEPLEDAAGGVPLLPRGLLVVLEDLVDDRQEQESWAWDVGPHGDSPAVRSARGSS